MYVLYTYVCTKSSNRVQVCLYAFGRLQREPYQSHLYKFEVIKTNKKKNSYQILNSKKMLMYLTRTLLIDFIIKTFVLFVFYFNLLNLMILNIIVNINNI